MDTPVDTKLIDGAAHARAVRAELRPRVEALRSSGVVPGLAVVLVGNDPASRVYVRSKARACEEVGLYSEQHDLHGSTAEEQVLERVRMLNRDPRIHGILVQLPLAAHISVDRVLHTISPEKDVDGFHPCNVGLLATGNPVFAPCTPAGVLRLLEREGISPEGKRAVIVGRSNIVGKPVAMMMLRKHATVTICHSRTRELGGVTREADILVAAIGRARFVTGDMIKPGAVVIDVGINRLPDGKLAGDVDFASAHGRASRLTPVPGGVGPMTIAMLLENTVLAAERTAKTA
ncbi:MAG: bifunctional methylenetetrahydrofolate dehydrogenase/methenyltetrahydrofolate cyclohydrolase [Betaproteobacteria bacterium RIFCSPLOWO2_12_FULL_63_13]|nr:MAG: bifunctional methylenetetrahydrofolate dehydrogenase/methenyltetrahydrofolate cyclohydrolase [Betaproteobacteria bacterium RIFCSPLOWO2_12_FULL_63_13]